MQMVEDAQLEMAGIVPCHWDKVKGNDMCWPARGSKPPLFESLWERWETSSLASRCNIATFLAGSTWRLSTLRYTLSSMF